MRVGEIKSVTLGNSLAYNSHGVGSRAKFLTFGAKDVTLYSDFDGTFLRAKSDNQSYYQAFDDFRSERDGKFKIFITTGRRLEATNGHGFMYAYEGIRGENPKFPRLDGVVTSDGGDIFLIAENGTVDKTPLVAKRDAVRTKTGWNLETVKGGITQIAEDMHTGFSFADSPAFHRLVVYVNDPQQAESLNTATREFFEANGISAESYVKDVDGRTALKIAPVINGRRVHKDFDVKEAIASAQRENDFVIVAGNASNDKELLNLFNYIGESKIDSVEKIPEKGLETMAERIRKLPVGVIFVDSEENKYPKLRAFMEKQQELFPDKVRIVKHSAKEDENVLVQACRELANKFFPKEVSPVKQPSVPESKGRAGFLTFLVLGALILGNIAVYCYKDLQDALNHKDTKKD